MKILLSFVLGLLISVVLSCCGARKIVQFNEHPFKVIQATYFYSEGEQSMTRTVYFEVIIDTQKIKLDSVYFNNSKAKLTRNKAISTTTYKGKLAISDMNKDFNLDVDPKKEFGNTSSIEMHIKRKKNEVIVSYFYKGKTSYYSILELKELSNSTGTSLY